MRKSLIAPLLVLFVITLSACAPADPLDHRVKASTPTHFSDWWDSVRDELPEDQRNEAYRLIRYLQDSTPRLKSMKPDDPYDPLCKRIDRLRLRHVMIFAYEDKNESLRKRVIAESGKLPALIETSSQTEDEEARRYIQSHIDYARGFIDQWNTEIAANEHRIAELQPASKR